MDITEHVLIKFFEYGVFAVLFVVLLYWVLKTHNLREQRYIELIDKMAEKLDILDTIADTLQTLRVDLESLHDKLMQIERTMWKQLSKDDE